MRFDRFAFNQMTNLIVVYRELDENDLELIHDVLKCLNDITNSGKSVETKNLEAQALFDSISDISIRKAMRSYWERHKGTIE
jgi:hypothetical protein